MAEAKLNWAEATVTKGKLSVPLSGEVPKGFKGHFETTVKLLGRSDWGTIELKKKVVQVGDIGAGDADEVRFYLEGLVEQADAAVEADQEKKSGKQDKDDEPSGPDAELTEQFRSFADGDSNSNSDTDPEPAP